MTKKTVLLMSMLFMLMLGMTSCNSCKGDDSEKASADAVLVDTLKNTNGLVVENAISLDRQTMYLQYKNDYRWFESCITLKDYLDSDAEVSVNSVSNIFMYVVDRSEKSFDTFVVLFTHLADTTAVEVKPQAFWVGDLELNEAEIKLTFAQAYERLMEANIVKPHSKQVVLRRELGPKLANAQYIFGNTRSHVYVDAVTGDVKTSNPAFEGFENDPKFGYAFTWLKADKGGTLNKPLGEWP